MRAVSELVRLQSNTDARLADVQYRFAVPKRQRGHAVRQNAPLICAGLNVVFLADMSILKI